MVSGYFFGTVPWVESNLTIVILAIVGVSVVPLVIKAGRHRWGRRRIDERKRKEGSMDCPVCGERLKEIERSGVMVDICPSCKGVWLDRGEIDKILEAEAQGRPTVVASERDDRHDPERRRSRRPQTITTITTERYEDQSRQRPETGRKRRTSLLQDLLGGLGGD